MLSRKMAGGNMLRLIQGMSNLNIYSTPWNISQRCIGQKTIYERLKVLTEKPKKPCNAYFEFKAEVEPEVKRKHPDLNIKDRARIVAQLWNECSEEKKDKYKRIARRKFEEYKKDLEKMEDAYTPQQKAEIAELRNDLQRLREDKVIKAEKQKRLVEMNKPKRPKNPFFRFLVEHGIPTVSTRQFVKEMAAKWATMSDHQKKSYVQEYEKECEMFKKQLEAWEDKMISLGHMDLVRSKTLKKFTLN